MLSLLLIPSASEHLFRKFLSERPDVGYSVTKKIHNRTLITKTFQLNEPHFLNEALYSCY